MSIRDLPKPDGLAGEILSQWIGDEDSPKFTNLRPLIEKSGASQNVVDKIVGWLKENKILNEDRLRELRMEAKRLDAEKRKAGAELKRLYEIEKTLKELHGLGRDPGYLANRPTPGEWRWNKISKIAKSLDDMEKELTSGPLCSDYDNFCENFLSKFELKNFSAKKSYTIHDAIKEIYGYFVFEKSGKQIFQLRPRMIDLLSSTDVPEEPLLFKAPYRSFCVQFPFGYYSYPLLNLDEEWGAGVIDAAYLVFEEDLGGKERFINIVWIISTAGRIPVHGEEIVFAIRFEVLDGSAASAVREAKKSLEARIISDAIKENKGFMGVILKTICPMINLVLYLNCRDVDVKEVPPEKYQFEISKARRLGPKKGRHAYERAKQYTTMIVKSVGEEEGKHAKEWELSSEQRRLTKRFLVRGHFRRYKSERYSEDVRKRTEAQPQWIRPFWKGPEFAEVLRESYIVKEPKKEVCDATTIKTEEL